MQVQESDMHRVATATGAQTQTTVNNLNPKVLGTVAAFEEKQVSPAVLMSVVPFMFRLTRTRLLYFCCVISAFMHIWHDAVQDARVVHFGKAHAQLLLPQCLCHSLAGKLAHFSPRRSCPGMPAASIVKRRLCCLVLTGGS